jgi:TrmH family RNA methyltransferase
LRILESQVACLPCSLSVFATLVETITPQGIAAVVVQPQLPLPAQPTLILVLDQLRDPGNAGTLLRSGEAAGVDLVLFAPGTVDPFNDKVVRAAMGAHFRLPLRSCADWAAVQSLLPAAAPCYLAAAAAQLSYDRVDWRQPAVLIIGGEATGASPMAQTLAQPISIPMHGQVESLNAAMAGAVMLFEAARQRRQALSLRSD